MAQHIFLFESELQNNFAEAAPSSPSLSPTVSEKLALYGSSALTGVEPPERNLSLSDFLTDVMRRKLLRRTQRQKGILSLKDLENIERCASSAYVELKEAWQKPLRW